jgi:uncharacterized membrane protein YedE/YeeE
MSPKSRLLDLASVAILLFGAACYIGAYAGMQSLQHAVHDPAAPIFAGYTRYVRLMQLSWFGIAVIVVGVIVGIGAAIHGSCTTAEATPPAPGPSPSAIASLASPEAVG